MGEEFSKLLKELNEVVKAGINVVVTAHAKMRKFEQPDEMGAYDRWEMKLSKQAGPLLKEWADMILFCNYKTVVVTTQSKTKKAQGGKRVVYTTHHPCWDAKNRHGLPETMDMTYYGSPLQEAIEGGVKDTRPEPVAETKEPKPEKKEPASEVEPEPDPEEGVEYPFKSPLEELKYKANLAGISLGDIQKACIKKKFKGPDQFVEDYEDDFIQSVLLDKWDGFVKFVLKN